MFSHGRGFMLVDELAQVQHSCGGLNEPTHESTGPAAHHHAVRATPLPPPLSFKPLKWSSAAAGWPFMLLLLLATGA